MDYYDSFRFIWSNTELDSVAVSFMTFRFFNRDHFPRNIFIFFREYQLSYSKSHIAHSNEKRFSSESNIFSHGLKFYASYEIHISLPFLYEREPQHYMRQSCTYYAIVLHLCKISFHIILSSRFYPDFLIKYLYAGLQIFSPIPYPALLHTIPISNISCWLQPIKIFLINLNAIPLLIPKFISCFLTSL